MIRTRLFVILLTSALFLSAKTYADNSPLVIIVADVEHPVAWLSKVAKEWGAKEVVEVTFNDPYRNYYGAITPLDFAQKGGDWALAVQKQVETVISEEPNRSIVIVSHSWGTLAVALALSGGVAGGKTPALQRLENRIAPIQLGEKRIQEWVTLSSQLGLVNAIDVDYNLRQLNIQIADGKPEIVDHWVNFYDPQDPASDHSHHLRGAENIEVRSSFFNRIKDTYTQTKAAHEDTWTHSNVSKYLREVLLDKTKTALPVATTTSLLNLSFSQKEQVTLFKQLATLQQQLSLRIQATLRALKVMLAPRHPETPAPLHENKSRRADIREKPILFTRLAKLFNSTLSTLKGFSPHKPPTPETKPTPQFDFIIQQPLEENQG